MTPEEAIQIVKVNASGRTRYAGQEPFVDEVLVDEIERLRKELELLTLQLAEDQYGEDL